MVRILENWCEIGSETELLVRTGFQLFGLLIKSGLRSNLRLQSVSPLRELALARCTARVKVLIHFLVCVDHLTDRANPGDGCRVPQIRVLRGCPMYIC